MARQHGYRVAASEYSEPASQRVSHRHGIPVHQGAFDASWFQGAGEVEAEARAPFDIVCFWDVIEHTEDPQQFLAEVVQVCRTGTVVGFSCPNVDSVYARALGARWPTLKPDEHLWHFSPNTIRRLFAENGFQVATLRTSPLVGANLARPDSMVGIAVYRPDLAS
jgi:2-polyprenyl-3-methyl-5-hydroxy-6-metoxy-1,4-benzoquinol methylase